MRLDLDSAWTGGRLARGVRIDFDDRGGGLVAGLEPIAAPANGWHALPGLVNAHCHLDLTSIAGETLAHAGFAAWVGDLVPRRARLTDAAIDEAVRAGARALLATGTVAVGDVDSFGRSLAILRTTPLAGSAFRELVGRVDAGRLAQLADELQRDAPATDAARGAAVARDLSPHAPYSTGAEVYAAAFAAAAGRPVASHVAESADEEELLLHGRGPLAQLFARMGFTAPPWPRTGAGAWSPLFDLVPEGARLLVIHGNRLARGELELCARRGWPLVHCPRSLRYFGHARPDLAHFVASGGVLALGTDSRASNEGLDLWAEMAELRAAEPALSDDAILAAATSGGRRALALPPAELRAGEPATFQLVRRRDGARGGPDLVAAAVRGELETAAVFVHGRPVHGGSGLPVST